MVKRKRRRRECKDDVKTAQDEMSKKSLHGCGFKLYFKNI